MMRVTPRTMFLASALALGGMAVMITLRPRPEAAGSGALSPARAPGSTAATPRRCSCGGACGGLARDAWISTASNFGFRIGDDARSAGHADTPYWCPLHPHIVSHAPGACRICEMPLSPHPVATKPPDTCACRSCSLARW